MFVDSILGTFRNMFKEVKEKNAAGDSFEKMKQALERMEQLAIEMDDFPAYSAKLASENVFTEFSTAYGEVLAKLSKKEFTEGSDNDEKLLGQTIKAYEEALIQLENNPDKEKLTAPIQLVIEIGKSGVPYPVFLRICEEKGLNKALEGGTVTREAIVRDIEFTRRQFLPVEERKYREMLKIFDELANIATFGIPDSFEFSLVREKIEWMFQPEINEWNDIIHRWEIILELIYDWLDSFCSFAIYDERWVDSRGQKYTLRNIKRAQECYPGFLKVREKIFFECFGLKWDNIFSHPTFLNEINANRVWYSDSAIDLIKRTYPYCKPYNKPSNELITEAEEIHKSRKYKR